MADQATIAAAIAVLINDNAANEITAQDVRDAYDEVLNGMFDIIPQAEAEAGVATVVRAFNALRVKQAIAAQAILPGTADVSGASWVLDEDNFASDSDTQVPTQQSTKAYIDAIETALQTLIASSVQLKGNYDANTNSPDLVTPAPGAVLKGYQYVVDVAGTFFGANVEVGDSLIAEVDDPAAIGDWIVLQTNLDAASIKTLYESNANTNAFTDAEQTKLAGIESGATADQTGAEIKVAYEAEANTNAFTDAEKSKLAGITSEAVGEVWASRANFANDYGSTLSHGNGIFVAPDRNSADVMTSADGWNWKLNAGARPNTNAVTGAAFGAGVHVICCNAGTGRLWWTEDGVTWKQGLGAEENSFNDVSFADGKFVAVAGSGTNRVHVSEDGKNWTPVAAAEANVWSKVRRGNGIWVAIAATGTNRVMTSVDALTWSPVAVTANSWQALDFGNYGFLAVATTGTDRAMTSLDGINWVDISTPDDALLWRVAVYGDGVYVITNTLGEIYTTDDGGASWTQRTEPAASKLWINAIYANGLFILTAETGGLDNFATSGLLKEIPVKEAAEPQRAATSLTVQTGKSVVALKGVSVDPNDSGKAVQGIKAIATRSTTTAHAAFSTARKMIVIEEKKSLIFDDDEGLWLYTYSGSTPVQTDKGDWWDGTPPTISNPRRFDAALSDGKDYIAVIYKRLNTTQRIFLRIGAWDNGTNIVTWGSEVEIADTGHSDDEEVAMDYIPGTNYGVVSWGSNTAGDATLHTAVFDFTDESVGTAEVEIIRAAYAINSDNATVCALDNGNIISGASGNASNRHHFYYYSRIGKALTKVDSIIDTTIASNLANPRLYAMGNQAIYAMANSNGVSAELQGWHYHVIDIVANTLSLGSDINYFNQGLGSGGPIFHILKKKGLRTSNEVTICVYENPASNSIPYVTKAVFADSLLTMTDQIELQDPNQSIAGNGHVAAEVSEGLFFSVWNDGSAFYNDIDVQGQTVYVGLSLGSASGDEEVEVLLNGNLEDAGFAFTPGADLFLDFSGNITEASTPFPAGRVATPTKILIDMPLHYNAPMTNAEVEAAYNSQVPEATQAEMEAGIETAVRRVNPAGIAQAIAALAPSVPATPVAGADGSWTPSFDAPLLSLDFKAIKYGKSWVACLSNNGTYGVIRSGNGKAWSAPETVPNTLGYSDAAYNPTNKVWIACANNVGVNNQFMRSYDGGRVWSNIPAGADNGGATSIVYMSSVTMFLACNTSSYVHRSTDDGTSWTASIPSANQWNDIAVNDAGDVAVMISDNDLVARTINGTSWTNYALAAATWERIIWVGGTINKFMAIGSTGAVVETSADGITWTAQTAFSNFVSTGFDVAVAGDRVLIIGKSITTLYLWYSDDGGVTWTEEPFTDGIAQNSALIPSAVGSDGVGFVMGEGYTHDVYVSGLD